MVRWHGLAASRLIGLVIMAGGLVACRAPATGGPALATLPAPAGTPIPADSATIPAPTAALETAAAPTTPIAPPLPTPLYDGALSPPCGVTLPALLPAASGGATLNVSDDARAALRAHAPPSAWPALQRLLDAPGSAALVAYQAGREAEGVYLNPTAPMPLASVAKLITLVAYVEAVAAGELNPLEHVSLAELDRYYLPNFDLGAHRRALEELSDEGRIISPEAEPAVLLEDVPWMMIRHSSNAAADYLHLRLGQARIEATAVTLGLNDPPAAHTAPCTFLGQFLMMGNHARGVANDLVLLRSYAASAAGAEAYGREVALLADAYVNEPAFREAERAWRAATRRPTIDAQRVFAGRLAPQGTAGGYAALMFRLAQNGLSNADSSYRARLYLEWPNQFEGNVELFSNVGYKNGSLPGVLTTTYYAYRWDDAAPVIVVLFYRDLPQQTYREWRFDLPHDELARWLLADPAAIPALSAALAGASVP